MASFTYLHSAMAEGVAGQSPRMQSTTANSEHPDAEMTSNNQESMNLPVMSTQRDTYHIMKAYTPHEDLELNGQFTERPDISIYCKECDRHIDLRLLNEHKYYHKALTTLKYKIGSKPDSVAVLIKRRRGVVRKLKKESSPGNPMDATVIQHINEAFEFLKADLEDTYETNRRIREKIGTEVDSLALNCTPECCTAVGIASSGNARWKSSMEDTRVYQDCFGNDPRKCFFAIYDGHMGRFAAEIAAAEYHHALLDSMSKFDPRTKCTCTFNMGEECSASEHNTHSRATSRISERGELVVESGHAIQQIISSVEEKMAAFEASEHNTNPITKSQKSNKNKDPFAEKMGHAFTKAHKYTDFLLSWGREENSKVRWSGCSTLTCVLQETPEKAEEDQNQQNEDDSKNDKKGPPPLKQLGMLHVANAGNVRAVLIRGNMPYRLSRDHTPYNNKEKNRVVKLGGDINESEKEMRVNGVLATTRGLGNHGDPELKKCVINEPYTTSVPIDQYAQFLILASQGVWEVLTDQQACDLCLQYYNLVWVLPQHMAPITGDILSESALHRGDTPTTEGLGEEPADDESSIADAVKERQKKPRASTARSHVSFAGDDLKEKDSENKQKSKGHKNAAKQKKQAEEHADLRTEIGSQAEQDYYSDEFEDDDDDGNLADIDTCTEVTSGRATANETPSQAQIERQFACGMAERLVQSALLAGAKDNITAMVVLLPGSGV